jgi:acetamidase/formamidase
LLALAPASQLRAQHVLRVTPSTVQWGYYAAEAKPVLTVKPGELVTIDTIVGIPDMLEELGAAADDSIREKKETYAKVKDRGPGPHFLTGPVAIEGAMPGDVLEIEIVEVRLRSPYGWIMIEPGSGARTRSDGENERIYARQASDSVAVAPPCVPSRSC